MHAQFYRDRSQGKLFQALRMGGGGLKTHPCTKNQSGQIQTYTLCARLEIKGNHVVDTLVSKKSKYIVKSHVY